MNLTYKQLIACMESGALHKLAHDTHLLASARMTLKPIWRQALTLYEDCQATLRELAESCGTAELSPLPNDPNRVIVTFKTIQAHRAYETAAKEFLNTEFTVDGEPLSYPLQRKIDAPTLLSVDDEIKLDWLFNTSNTNMSGAPDKGE